MNRTDAINNNIPIESSTDSTRTNKTRSRWYSAIILVTLLPLIGLPLLSTTHLLFRESFLIGLGVFVGGVCHVASTLYFYLDRDARAAMHTMKTRFYLLPIAVIGLSILTLFVGALVTIPLNAVAAIFLAHLVWLYYHYQKQNYGLLAFASASQGQRLPKATVYIVLLPPLAGGLATIPHLLAAGLEFDLPQNAWLPVIHTAAYFTYFIATIATIALAIRYKSVFKQPLVLLFLTISFCFFLPGLFIENLEYAFWSYAIAHGLQYLLMVGIVSAQAPAKYLAIAGFILAAIIGGWCLQRFAGNHALFICGILLTWVHFILDARLWRMNNSAVRPFLRSRFAFIFDR